MRTITALLVLAACGTEGTVTPDGVPQEIAQDPVEELDTSVTQGNTRADHVEVAPGVFLLKALVESGRYRVLEQDPLASTGGYGTGTTTYWYPYTGYYGGGFDCDNSAFGDNGDEISDSQLLDGKWLGWHSFAGIFSFDIDGDVSHTISTHASSIIFPGSIEGIGVVQYVFLNDDYIGFAEEHLMNTDLSLSGIYLDVPCDDGYLDLSTFSTMYMRDGDSALEVTNRADAYTVCCPG